MIRYEEVVENKPIILEYRQVEGRNVASQFMACCDCGLVHEIAHVPLKTRMKIYYWRAKKRTANMRRRKKLFPCTEKGT